MLSTEITWKRKCKTLGPILVHNTCPLNKKVVQRCTNRSFQPNSGRDKEKCFPFDIEPLYVCSFICMNYLILDNKTYTSERKPSLSSVYVFFLLRMGFKDDVVHSNLISLFGSSIHLPNFHRELF